MSFIRCPLGVDVVKSIANRKMNIDDELNKFDEKVNEKCNRALDLAEQMKSAALGLKETSNKFRSMPNAFLNMNQSDGIISIDDCNKLAGDTDELSRELESQGAGFYGDIFLLHFLHQNCCILHQNCCIFTPKLLYFYTRIFCILYTKIVAFFTPKFLHFLHQNCCIFIPIFLHQNCCIFYTKIVAFFTPKLLHFLHQFFYTKIFALFCTPNVCIFTPTFLHFYTNIFCIFTPKFLNFYAKNFCFFTEVLALLKNGAVAKLLIRLSGVLYDTKDRDTIITISLCWIHQPEVNDNFYTITEETLRTFI